VSQSSFYCRQPTCKAYHIAILMHGHCAGCVGRRYRGAATAAPGRTSCCGYSHCEGCAAALGRSGPNLQPGTVYVCGMNGLRKGMNTTQHPPSPASRAGADLPTNVEAVSPAVSYVNTHRPRFQARALPAYTSNEQALVCRFKNEIFDASRR